MKSPQSLGKAIFLSLIIVGGIVFMVTFTTRAGSGNKDGVLSIPVMAKFAVCGGVEVLLLTEMVA